MILVRLLLGIVLAMTCVVTYGKASLLGDIVEDIGLPLPEDTSFGSKFLDYIRNVRTKLAGVIKELGECIKIAIEEMFNTESISVPTNLVPGEKCCGKYGCFPIYPPLLSECRPISAAPTCQELLRVRFYLWTRDNREGKDVIDPEDLATLRNSHFRNGSSVFVYINGYLGSGDMCFVRDMKDAVLDKEDTMFISVEWVNGARKDYVSSVADGRMVSAVTAFFIETCMINYAIRPENVYIVGLSLGAHVAGEVGKRIKNIGRITGIDPAKQLYEGCDATARLCNTDATFVDIIHADMEGFGTRTPSGHADFYPHGGRSQPACLGLVGCSHILAVYYYIDTIRSTCPYYGYQSDDRDNFLRGKSATGCGQNKTLCAPMGYRAIQWKNNSRESPTQFYLEVGTNGSYCVYHYYVEINCTSDEARLWRYGRNKDELYINLIGEGGQTGFRQANQNSIRYTTLNTVTTIITSENQIGTISSISLKWVPHGAASQNVRCQSGKVTKPTATCCVESFDSVAGRCLMCPYVVASIYAKNLETSNSATFSGGNGSLVANKEVVFQNRQEK